jgi:hypothetical protein
MKRIILIVMVVALVACGHQERNNPPATPTGLQITSGDQKLSLTWTANPESDVVSYLLAWRNSLTNQSQSKSVAAPATVAVLEGLSNDTAYLVTIAAVDKVGQQSVVSSPVLGSPKAAPLPDQPPVKPGGLIATAQDGQVALNWTPNADPTLKLYRLHYGSSSTNLDKTLSVDAPGTSSVVVGLSNDTPYFFALEAENNKGLVSPRSDMVSATPKAVPRAPLVQEVSITDYGLSNQVRQGAGVIEIVIKGFNLDTLETAKLGSYDLTVLARQADTARLEATIPHGATLGDLALMVENSVASFTREAVIEITKITAATAPDLNPSDTDGKGTPNRPFRTLSKALSVAQKGDVVLLGAGTYQTGETWPQVTGGSIPNKNVPDGVVLEGQSSDRGAVLLQGPGKEQEVGGLVFAGDGTARNLTLRGFKYALVHEGDPASPSATIAIDNVASSSNFDGLYVRFADSLSVSNSVFNSNTASGIFLFGAFRVTLNAVQANKNQLGIFANYGTNLDLTQTFVNENSSDGLILNRASAAISNSEFSSNAGHGINLFAENQEQGLQLRKSQVFSNSKNGVWIQGFPRSIVIGAAGDDPGEMFINANGALEIADERQANTGNNNFFFVNALVRNAVIPNGLIGPGSEPAGVKIVNPGNVIRFNTL